MLTQCCCPARGKTCESVHVLKAKRSFNYKLTGCLFVLLQRSERGRTRVHFMTNVDNALRILEENNVSTCAKDLQVFCQMTDFD